MSQPAVRQGDLTAHGGSIVQGDPTVLINGMPAARQGDFHLCPMCSGTVPHVGGPILQGAPTVLINGRPAARQGDPCTCNGPPDAIASGEPTVLIGSGGNPVKIGGSGPVQIGGSGPVIIGGGTASGGGAGHGSPGRQGALAAVAAAQTGPPEAPTRKKHWIEFRFEDAAGNPVSGIRYALEDPEGNVSESWSKGNGLVRRSGLPEGTGTVTVKTLRGAEWSAREARVEETVTVTATAQGFEAGTPATVQVRKRHPDGPPVLLDEIDAEVRRDEVEVNWAYPRAEPTAVRAASPPPQSGDRGSGAADLLECRATVRVKDHPTPAHTGLLVVEDVLEGKVTDLTDEPRPNDAYRLTRQGPVRSGTVDRTGHFSEEHVSPGRHWCE